MIASINPDFEEELYKDSEIPVYPFTIGVGIGF
jgi:hypothetical protein